MICYQKFCALAGVLLLAIGGTAVADLYWDANGGTAGMGGTGNWTDPNTWRTVPDTDPLQNWADGNNAVFAGTAGTVTVSGNVAPNSITINTAGYTISGSNTITLGGASPNSTVSTGTSYLSAPLAGTGGLTFTGPGTLRVTSTNSYNGPTVINSGTLQLTASAPASGSLLWLDGADASTVSTTGSNVTKWQSKSSSYSVTPTGTNPTYGTNTLNGNSVVTFNNSIMTNTGLLTSANFPTSQATEFVVFVSRANQYGVMNTSSANTQWWRYTGDGNTKGYIAEFRAVRIEQQPGNGIMPGIGGSALITIESGSGVGTYGIWKNGTQVTTADPYWGISSTLTIGGGGASPNLVGDIAEVLIYNRALSAAERQAVEYYLTSKWYGAGVTPPNVIPDGSAVTVALAGTLDLNGANETIGSLSGAGNVTLLYGTLTTGGNNDPLTTFSGVISGTGGLVKEGTGTMVLSNANIYTGTTTINNGTFRLTGGLNRLNQGGDVVVNGPGVLDINGASQTQAINNLSGNGTVALNMTTGWGLFTVGYSNGSSTFAGTTTGTGTMVKAGTGTLTLTGSTGHTGGTWVRGGVLQVGDGTTPSGTLSGVVSNNAAVVFNRADNSASTANIVGTGTLEKKGAGTLTLQGENSYTGGTTITAGILQGTTSSLRGSITNNSAMVFNQDTDGTFVGAVGGTGTLTKSGNGVVTLAGNNTYGGTTTISGGTLRLQSGALAPPSGNMVFWLDATASSTVHTTGSSVTSWDSKVGSYTVAPGGTSPVYTASGLNGNAVVTFNNSTMTNTGGVLTSGNFSSSQATEFVVYTAKADSYTVMNTGLDNQQYWRYSGDQSGYFGEFRGAGAGNRIQWAPIQGVMPSSGNSALISLESGSGTGTYQIWRNGALAFSGNPAWALSSTLTIGGGNNGGPALNGDIGEVLIYNTALTAVQRQAVESYLLAKWFGAGLGPYNSIPDNSAVTVGPGATFDLNGVNETIGSLAGAGNVTLGSATLTTGGNNDVSTTFSGAISGAGGLTKEGTGTMVLSGTSSYGGATTVNNGKLQLTISNALNSGNNVTVTGPGIFEVSGNFVRQTIAQLWGNGTVSITAGSSTNALTVGSGNSSSTFSGTITGTGRLEKTGSGTFTLTGTASHTGATVINSGTFQVGNGGANGSLGGNVVNAGALVFNRLGTLTYSGLISGNGTVEQRGPGTLILQGDNSGTGGMSVTGGILQGNSTSLRGNISTSPGTSVVFDQATAGTFVGSISGSGALTKSNNGVLTVAANNSYGGATTISGGTLRLQPTLSAPSGAVFWLDSTDGSTITKDGSNNVSQWQSKTGGYVVTASGNKPVYTSGGLNGNAVVHFNNSVMTNADLLTEANFSGHVATEFVVYTALADGYTVMNTAPNNSAYWRWNNDVCGYFGEFRTGRFEQKPGPGVMPGNGGSSLITLQSGTSTYQIWRNGALVFSDNPSWARDSTLTIGGGNTGAPNLAGNIGEVLIYNTALSAADRQAVEDYLLAKWFGVGLGPYNAIPDNSAVSIDGGATLDLNGVNERIGSLAGAGNVQLGTGTLTTGGNSAPTTTFSGSISGSGGLVKEGIGEMVLSGANSYGGPTTIATGALKLGTGGSFANSSVIDVQAGAFLDLSAKSAGFTFGSGQTLKGKGTVQMPVGQTVSILGTLAPGESPGTLTFTGAGTLDISGAAGLDFEIGNPGDLVRLTDGTLSIGSGVLGFDDFTFTPVSGYGLGTYTLIETSQLIQGSLDAGNLGGRLGGNPVFLTLSADGTDLLLEVVPEPSSLALAVLALAGLLAWAIRRRRTTAGQSR